MIKLLVVCHGALAPGLVHAMELIAGPQPEVVAIRLDEADPIDDLEARVDAAVQDRQPDQAVLILVDMFGASPFNVSARISQRYPAVEVVTGANLPMLLETTLAREVTPLAELAVLARDAGLGSIKILSEALKQG